MLWADRTLSNVLGTQRSCWTKDGMERPAQLLGALGSWRLCVWSQVSGGTRGPGQSDHGTQGSETAGHRSGILADCRLFTQTVLGERGLWDPEREGKQAATGKELLRGQGRIRHWPET